MQWNFNPDIFLQHRCFVCLTVINRMIRRASWKTESGSLLERSQYLVFSEFPHLIHLHHTLHYLLYLGDVFQETKYILRGGVRVLVAFLLSTCLPYCLVPSKYWMTWWEAVWCLRPQRSRATISKTFSVGNTQRGQRSTVFPLLAIRS